MTKDEIKAELDWTYTRMMELLESIPESDYGKPTGNPAWTVGDVLFHITLGPRALALEIWMTVYMNGIFQFTMKYFPSGLFNRINASFGRQGSRISRQRLIRLYGKAHKSIKSMLSRVREEDLAKTVVYPEEFVSELKGQITVERLFRYVKGHFEVHSGQLSR